MLFKVGVDMLDHCRQCCRLSATRRTANQDHPPGGLRYFSNLVKKSEFLEARHDCLDITHGQAPLPSLLEQIGPESADARNEIGKVNLPLLVEPFLQMRRGYVLNNL